jgi:hypothetical protein
VAEAEAGARARRNWLAGVCVCVCAWLVCAGIAEVEMSAFPAASFWLRPFRDHIPALIMAGLFVPRRVGVVARRAGAG